MPTEIKICGLSDAESVDAALEAGADFLGFVFFARSPRNVGLAQAASLAGRARGRAGVVALIVDATDAELAEITEALKPDLLQLHGSEAPDRVAAIRAGTGVPVMKALGIGEVDDLRRIEGFASADRLLLDAKPPRGATRPGGNGATFDWAILRGFSSPHPWLLSGGLDPGNVAAALAATGAAGVDVSSGVENAPGKKDSGLIRAFIAAVRATDRPVGRLAS